MPRRTATLLASTITLIALLCVGAADTVPYAEMSPGPTVNTLGTYGGAKVIQITGQKTYPTTGNLNMTTVRVTGADYTMNVVEAVLGWLRARRQGGRARHPLPAGADRGAGRPGERRGVQPVPGQRQGRRAGRAEDPRAVPGDREAVAKGGAAEGVLHAGDVIKAVDGNTVKQSDEVAKFVTKHQPGQQVVFTVVPAKAAAARRRQEVADGRRRTVTLTTRLSHDDCPSARSSASRRASSTSTRSPSTSGSRTSAARARA